MNNTTPPAHWYEPPYVHEEDGCEQCHKGHIENDNFPVMGCDLCEELLQELQKEKE